MITKLMYWYSLLQVAVFIWVGIWALISRFFEKPDPRFEGDRLWYRS